MYLHILDSALCLKGTESLDFTLPPSLFSQKTNPSWPLIDMLNRLRIWIRFFGYLRMGPPRSITETVESKLLSFDSQLLKTTGIPIKSTTGHDKKLF